MDLLYLPKKKLFFVYPTSVECTGHGVCVVLYSCKFSKITFFPDFVYTRMAGVQRSGGEGTERAGDPGEWRSRQTCLQ